MGAYLNVLSKANRIQDQGDRELTLTVEDLRYLDVDTFFSEELSTRRNAVHSLVKSSYPNKTRVLLQLLKSEPNLDLKHDIRKALNELQSHADFWGDDLGEKQRKVKQALEGANEKERQEAVRYILKEKLTEMLPFTLNAEEKYKTPTLRIANIQLMALKGPIHCNRIVKYLEDDEEQVVNEAIKNLAIIGGTRHLMEITRLLQDERTTVQSAARETLELLSQDQALELCRKLSRDKEAQMRLRALDLAEFLNLKRASQIARDLVKDPDNSVQKRAMDVKRFLHSHGEGEENPVEEEEVPELIAALQTEKEPLKIAQLIQQISDSQLPENKKLKVFMTYIAHPEDRVRANALEAMIPVLPSAHHDFFLPYLDDKNNRIRGNAIMALATEDGGFSQYETKIVQSLRSLSEDERPVYRLTALYCIGVLKEPSLISFLKGLSQDPVQKVRDKAKEILDGWPKLSGEQEEELDKAHKVHMLTTKKKPKLTRDEVLAKMEKSFDPQKLGNKGEQLDLLLSIEQLDQDFVIIEKLLVYLKICKDPELIAQSIRSLKSQSFEDRWVHLNEFMTYKDSQVQLAAFEALMQTDSFRLLPKIHQLVQAGNLNQGNKAQMVAIAMPQLIMEKEQLALKAMQILSKGNDTARKAFASSLRYWMHSSPILERTVQDLLLLTPDETVLDSCLDFLFRHVNSATLLEKIEFLQSKASEEILPKKLNKLKIKVQNKIKNQAKFPN